MNQSINCNVHNPDNLTCFYDTQTRSLRQNSRGRLVGHCATQPLCTRLLTETYRNLITITAKQKLLQREIPRNFLNTQLCHFDFRFRGTPEPLPKKVILFHVFSLASLMLPWSSAPFDASQPRTPPEKGFDVQAVPVCFCPCSSLTTRLCLSSLSSAEDIGVVGVDHTVRTSDADRHGGFEKQRFHKVTQVIEETNIKRNVAPSGRSRAAR